MYNAEITNKINRILEWLNKYKNTTKCKGVVLGISGGKDSTVVAMLAKKIWNDNVLGILMPNGEQKDINDSLEIVEQLNLKHIIVNINEAYESLINNIEQNKIEENLEKEGLVVSPKSKTNIPPRLRMTTLYAVAQSLGYQVIGTGNRSENFIGWFTKWGDGACDFNPIAHLTKTQVVEIGKVLASEFNLDEKFITKIPSDGLTGKSDEDNLGFTYDFLDKYITLSPQIITSEEDKIAYKKVEDMYLASRHKRQLPYNINSFDIH